MKDLTLRTIYILFFLFVCLSTMAQIQDKKVFHFNGDVSVTNNGFSFIPTFSLGEPASIVNLSVGGKRFAFEPQFRFELEGLKPWSFIAIWRYDLIQNEKTSLRLGAHFPAISYRKQLIEINGVMTEQIYTQRWFTPEMTISHKLTDNISIGSYYIHGFGLEPEGQTKNTDFISLRMKLNIPLTDNWFLRWNPQVYYLRMDDLGGYFAAQSITIARKKIPVSISTSMNLSLESENEIPSKDFDWNVGIIYTFKNEFNKK